MSEQAAAPKRPVGRPKKRRDADDAPINGLWQTDVVTNRDPDFVYQFFREDEVRDKLRATRLALVDFATGKRDVHDIPGWQIVTRDTGPEDLAGYRPDEGKPVDNVLRHGPHVCMKLHKSFWKLLQKAQEQRADAYESVLRGGKREAWNLDGDQMSSDMEDRSAVRLKQQPLKRN